MKKFAAMVSALVLCVALSVAGTAYAKTFKVKSTITMSFANGGLPYSPYTQDTFAGKVKAKKGCKKGRTVSVSNVSVKTKTDSNGDWSLAVGNAGAGTYTATVAKKKIKRGKNKVICKAASSAPVVVP